MARILFVNQFYWPDVASTGQHLTDLCEHLAAQGHEVRVLSSSGAYLDTAGRALPRHEMRHGVEILRVPGLGFGQRTSLWRRVLEYAAFHLQAARRVAFGSWAEVVVTLTTPPLLGLWGALAQKRRGRRHVAYVMDLHPDAEFALGLLRPKSPLGRLLERLNAWPLKRADRVVVLGAYMAARVLAKGAKREALCEIPVWTDGRAVQPLSHAHNALRQRLGWNGRFVVLYSGNAGLVHRFDELYEAMERVYARNPAVLFAFVGGGPRRAEIEREVARRGLPNAEFHAYFPRASLGQSLPAADVHFLSLRQEQAGIAVPGKLYGAMASGRPVLFLGPERCESADTLRSSGAGFAFGYGQSLALSEAILTLAEQPNLCRQLGQAARQAFERQFDQPVCLEAWSRLINGLVPLEHPTLAGIAAGDAPLVSEAHSASPAPASSTPALVKPALDQASAGWGDPGQSPAA
jgi:glycosyltransferase involved in cell wall biosynthesis